MSRSETPTNSQADPCAQVKQAYEKAFLNWHENVFIPGKGEVKEICCLQEYEDYRKCATEWLQKNRMQAKLEKWEQNRRAEEDKNVSNRPD